MSSPRPAKTLKVQKKKGPAPIAALIVPLLPTPTTDNPAGSPANSNRIGRAFAVRQLASAHDAFISAAPQIDNGDEAAYADKSGTYTKGVKQSGVGVVDAAAYVKFRKALDTGKLA